MAGAIYSEAQNAVARAFTEARKDAQMKQTELADAIGKHQSFISDVERGQRRIDIVEAFVIAKALGYEPTDFYQKLIRDVPDTTKL